MLNIPTDFEANWHKMTREELAEHHGITVNAVTTLCRHLGLTRKAGAKVNAERLPPPAGFEKIMSLPEDVLCKRLGCRRFDVRRWRRQFAFVPNQSGKYEPVAPTVFRDATLAARYLQKHGPVSRCTADGKMGKGDHWMRGNKVKTDAEVIEIAVRLGWDAEEWRRVPTAAGVRVAA